MSDTENTPTAATAITSFDQLISDPELLAALKRLEISVPTPVQVESIPLAMSGTDLIAQAQTGSGKTLAFSLPILSKITKSAIKDGTLALILSPTREIALQVQGVIASLFPDIIPTCLIGGRNSHRSKQELIGDPRIVVGTPGRVLDFLNQRALNLKNCEYFVLDEADEMLGIGFLEDVKSILKQIPMRSQGMFFSATITPRVQSLAREFLKDPKQVLIATQTDSAPEIEHLFCRVDGGLTSKAAALCAILEKETPQACLIFCNTKSDTELVEVWLRRRNIQASRLNSDLSQSQRESIMNQFRDGSLPILIATDIAARGIDVKELDLVINYAIHDQHETYVHRSGRTGRAGRAGKAISIVGPQDFGAFYSLTKNLSIPLTEIEVPKSAAEAA